MHVAMGRWIFGIIVILLLVAGTYWFLQHKGVQNCYDNGGEWDYRRWKCDTE